MQAARFLPTLALCLAHATASAAGAAPEQPMAFEPLSRTASAITGPVILSRDRIVFGNGERLDLEYLRDLGEGDSAAQLFRLSGSIGPLMNGNTLCGDTPPEFLSVGETAATGDRYLSLSFYAAGTEPGAAEDSGLCGIFNYIPPETWPVADVRDADTTPSSDPGKWKVRRSTNPIDDTRTVVLSLTADSGASRWGKPVVFVARCQSNDTEVYAIWNAYVGDDSSSPYDEWKHVTVRIGDEPASQERWGVSTDKEATFAPSWAGNLLKRMLAANRMVLQLTPYGENPITAVFDTTGLDVALVDLAKTCDWSY